MIYQGEIPLHPDTKQPMYHVGTIYRWKYQGKLYPTWHRIKHLFGEDAARESERVTIPPIWIPNKPFQATMKIEGFSRGRSAANFDVEDENGRKYTIFMKDLLYILENHTVSKGKIEGLTWCFCKRGQNYGIQVYEEN